MLKKKTSNANALDHLNSTVLKLLLSSVVISFLLTASIYNFNLIATIATFVKNPALSLFSTFVILLIQLVLLTLINELYLTLWISILVSIIISVVNILKIQFRSEPLIPTDLGFLFDLPAIIRLITPQQIFFISVLIIGIVLTLIYIIYRQRKHQVGIKIFEINKQSTYRRVFVLTLSFVLLLTMRTYQVDGSMLRRTLTSMGFQEYEFDILKSYRENGFINGYISNISDEVMLMPDDYSKERIEAIMAKYQDYADIANLSAKYDSFEDISVVYILSESLSNPQRVNGVEIEENPLPFISDPKGKVSHGVMVSPVYGGTTANTEFEVLTGLSMKYLASGSIVPFKSIIPQKESFPSMVSEFRKGNPAGEALTLHSYNDKLFKRPENYEIFGFDRSLFDVDMNHQDALHEGGYINDTATFNEALSLLDNDKSQFINVVTMQNHSPYGGKYDQAYPGISVRDDVELEETLADYTQGIHYSDQAIEQFIEAVSQLDKKVIVVYYGDHLPGLYNSLLPDNTDPFDLYTTDYFIYKNFDQDQKQVGKERVVSASSMNALTHLSAGVKLNPLHVLNLKLHEKAVGGSALNYTTAEGTKQYAELSQDVQDMIQEYKLIQYDILIGENYSAPYIN